MDLKNRIENLRADLEQYQKDKKDAEHRVEHYKFELLSAEEELSEIKSDIREIQDQIDDLVNQLYEETKKSLEN